MTRAQRLSNQQLTNNRSKQQGLGLISAIFVITLLALIAAGMAGINANAARQHSQQILSVRAHSAAQSGLEIYSAALEKNKCTQQSTTYTYNSQGLYDCKAQVSCTSVSYQSKQLLTLTSISSCGSDFETATNTLTRHLVH